MMSGKRFIGTEPFHPSRRNGISIRRNHVVSCDYSPHQRLKLHSRTSELASDAAPNQSSHGQLGGCPSFS